MKELTIRMKADDVAEVLLYDAIGQGSPFEPPGIDAKTFRAQVKAVRAKTMNLRINSPGGSVLDAAAMLATLDAWPGRIEADVDGIAGSAASFIMMAADEVRMASNAFIMIHDPVGMAMGGAAEMRKTAALLDKVREQIIDAYSRHSKAGREQIGAWMAEETWFTGQEAISAGLAHSITSPVSVAAFAGAAVLLARLGAKKVPPLPEPDPKAMAETRRRMEIARGL